MMNRIENRPKTAASREISPGPRAQRGFSLLEMANVMALTGLILGPLAAGTISAMGSRESGHTASSLELARDALLTYAAANNGCLPFAADYEGGIDDADADGDSLGGYSDTGAGVADSHGGDLPWSELDIDGGLRDGNELRIQYFISSAYSDSDSDGSNGIDCAAGERGSQWRPSTAYAGSAADPAYVYYTPAANGTAKLYKIVGTLSAGRSPNTATGIATDVTADLPGSMLEIRRGPDVAGGSGQSDVVSGQNVFVLIASGVNNNATAGRKHIRDANHKAAGGTTDWAMNLANVDNVVFSATRDEDESDSENNGDDTILVVSFLEYKTAMAKYDMRVRPLCDTSC